MRKKYLSALLFGALLFASTGTFTSCKDYDDDIDGLQEQIDSMETTISTLQNQVSSGYWITSLNAIDGGFAVTFSNGQSYNIVNGADGQDGAAGKDGTQITIGEDGYWYFDGVKSDYQAVVSGEDGKVKAPYVEDGYWYFYAEDSEEATKSDIKAAGAAYAVEANGGWNLYLPDADGEMNEAIFLPGAAASITDIELRDLDGSGDISAQELTIYNAEFTFSASNSAKAKGIEKASDWKGTKSIPADGSKIYSSSQLGLRINPTDVDGTDVEYVLTTSQNNTLSNVKLNASEYKELVTSRAAYGNGLYTLEMESVVLSKDQAKTLDDEVTKYATAMFAVNAANAIRTDYAVEVKTADAGLLTAIQLGNDDKTQIKVRTSENSTNTGEWKNIELGKTYTVNGVESSALYDMYFEVSNTVADAYGVVIDNENHTFTVNKNPDASTRVVSFPMTVYTCSNRGYVYATTITIGLSTEIPSDETYSLISTDISDKDNFSFDLQTMKNGLSNLQSWNLNVDLSKTTYKLFEKYENGTLSDEVANAVGDDCLFTPAFVNANGTATTDVNAATDVKVTIDNEKAAAAGVELGKTYYLEVTYNDKDNSAKLNSSVIPITFTAPTLETFFDVKSGYVKDGVINAYFEVPATGTATKDITLDKYFNTDLDNLNGVTYNLDDETTVYTDADNKEYKTDDAVEMTGRTLSFTSDKKEDNSQFEVGYGVDLIINATKDNYEGWKYAEEEDGIYTFEIKMMSPIVEGTVRTVNSGVTISANDMVNGAPITGDDIVGADYNGNTYVVVPDKYVDGTTAAWTNPQIQSVAMAGDTAGYVSSVGTVAATQDGNKATVPGYFNVFGNSLSTTTTVELPITVTDAWGYTVTVNIPVTINVN